MTLKQQKLLKALETSNTLAEAGRKAGYSVQARHIYTPKIKSTIINHIHSDPEKIKERFEHLSIIAERKGDLTNAMRGSEALARVQGMFIDKSEVKTTADVNLNERLTRLTHILSSNRIGNLLPAQAQCKPSEKEGVDNSNPSHCKPSSDGQVDNVPAPNVSDNISLVPIKPLSNNLPLNSKPLLPLPIATSYPSIARKSMEGVGEGGLKKGRGIGNLPPVTLPLSKVASKVAPKVAKVKGAPLAEGEGHCFKCRVRRPIGSHENIVMKNGLKALKGKCSICGTVMFKILKKDKV